MASILPNVPSPEFVIVVVKRLVIVPVIALKIELKRLVLVAFTVVALTPVKF